MPLSMDASVEAPLSTEVSAEAPISTEVSVEANTPALATNQTAPEAFDIEAELDKREARAKKFGAEFNREQCRAQLLRGNAQQASGLREDMLASRRARFGSSDSDKMQARKQRFGEPNASKEVLSAREAKFGKVEKNHFQNLRGQKRFGNRRNNGNGKRVFYCHVC